jgi:hypothetical protein
MIRSKRAAVRLLQDLLVVSSPSLDAEPSSLLTVAIDERDTPTIFRLLMDGFSFQGISDANARSFIAKHGNADWDVVSDLVRRAGPICKKLAGFDSYRGCGFRKTGRTCNNPVAQPACPVPRLTLRKGVLNEQAFSLFFFIRDVCHGDLVAYIDQMLDERAGSGDIDASREALLASFTSIVGVERKLASMMLSSLLTAGPDRSTWVQVGRSMIVVDSLVHNLLHRTGILYALKAEHPYGPRCYSQAGCEMVLRALGAVLIERDTALSPRSIQHAVWRFCAGDELAICNGNNIRDTRRCRLDWCPLFECCSRRTLRRTRSKLEARP